MCKAWILLAVALCGIGAAHDTSLMDAVRQRNVKAVTALLENGADVNATTADGTTALDIAALVDDVNIASVLIEKGAKVRSVNRYGVGALWLAAQNGDAALMTRLLEAGADPNAALPEGETVLMTASRTGTAAAVAALIAAGADVNAHEGWKGQTALMWAAASDNTAAIAVLLGAGADLRAKSKGGFTALLFAVRSGCVDATRALLTAGADVNQTTTDGTSALVVAVLNGHFEVASQLLDRGADPTANKQGWTALHQIAWVRRPNTGMNSPGPVPDGDVDSLTLIRKLVAHGADINARETREPQDSFRNSLNRVGATPFLLAAKAVDLDMMHVLVELGADPLAATEDGTTPLMAAAGVGIYAVGDSPGTAEEADAAVKLCLELGGDANAVDASGNTALHGAALRGANGAVSLLVEAGARLDVKNKRGWTPLRIAEGVWYNGTTKQMLHTAVLLRELMTERGVSIDDSLSSGGTAYAPPKAPAKKPKR